MKKDSKKNNENSFDKRLGDFISMSYAPLYGIDPETGARLGDDDMTEQGINPEGNERIR